MKSFLHPSEPDLAQLEAESYEPLQSIGHIQPHGAILALKPDDLTVVLASENIGTFLGQSANEWLGQPLSAVLAGDETGTLLQRMQEAIAQNQPSALNPFIIPHPQDMAGHSSLGTLHPADDVLLLNLEPWGAPVNLPSHGLYTQANQIFDRLKRTQTLTHFYQAITEEVRALTQFDRVMLYRFDERSNGVVMAEALKDGLEPYLGLHYPAVDIPGIARSLYAARSHPRCIPTIHYTPTPLVTASADYQALDLTQTHTRGVSSCHLEYLENMGVVASMSIPVVAENQLWGLIACHHYEPKTVDYLQRTLCELLGRMVSVELVVRLDREMQQYSHQIQQIEESIRDALAKHSNQIELVLMQHRESLLSLVKADGVAIALSKKVILMGDTPDRSTVKKLLSWLNLHHPEPLFQTDSLSHHYCKAGELCPHAGGVLAISMTVQQATYRILWFRTEQMYTVSWGGNPEANVDLTEAGTLRLCPRGSFSVWRELVKGRSLPWLPIELKAAQELRYSLMLTALETSQTELQQALMEAEQASRAKSNFLANMSHEIRTPMNAILGFTQLLENTDLTDEQRSYLSSITKGGESLLTIINDILDISRLEAGELRLTAIEFNVNSLINDLTQLFQPQANAKGITLVSSIGSTVPKSCIGSANRLQQVLTNLLGNAVKFTEEGAILLRVDQVADDTLPADQVMLRFSVRDTGIGIAPAHQAKIFNPFSQVDDSSTRPYEGTGLGLTICRRIVDVMGGRIGLESSPGLGSTFWFTVPLTRTAPNAEEPPAHAIASPASQPRDTDRPTLPILVVEDMAQNRTLMLTMLKRLGYQAEAVCNGQEALDLLRKQSYRMILMDCQMPIINGYEATRHIRQQEMEQEIDAMQRVTIIGVTAYAMMGDREKCLACGMDDYLSKPFRLDDLTTLLEKWL